MNNIIDNNITLEQESHTYQHAAFPELEFISVTTLIEHYFEGFDSVAIATNLCSNNPKYIGTRPEELISQWDAARDHGIEVHAQIELYLKNKIEPEEIKAKHGLDWLEKYRKKSDIEFFSEVIVFSTELQIAGTIDILAYDKSSDSYEIIDWKSNKKINISSYRGKMGTHPITENLMDCNFTHYSLQLSLYRYILENYYGLTITNQMIGHLSEIACHAFITPYHKEYIMQIINNNVKEKD